MHILAIVAGTNHPSNAETLTKHFLEGLRAACPHASIETMRLDTLAIEHFSLKHYDPATDQGADFSRIQEAMLQANGVVIASPVWNFGVPAHLKNLLDRMGSFALDFSRSVGTLKGLPSFLLYTGGMPVTGWPLTRRTTSFVDTALQYFGATIVGHHYEGRCTAGRGIFKEVVSSRPEALEAVRVKGVIFGNIVEKYAREGVLPAKQTLQSFFWQVLGNGKKFLGL